MAGEQISRKYDVKTAFMIDRSATNAAAQKPFVQDS